MKRTRCEGGARCAARCAAGPRRDDRAKRTARKRASLPSHAGVTGIVLTKLDGTAKGGIVVAIARELRLADSLCGHGRADRRPGAI